MKRQSVMIWVGLAVVLFVAAVFSGGPRRQEGQPLDPSATDPTGARALVLLWEELGADVGRGLPDESTDVAVVLVDRLDDEQREELRRWVAAGGTLVVTDARSDLAAHPGLPPGTTPSLDQTGSPLNAGACTVPDLVDLTIEGSPLLQYDDLGSANDLVSCFGDGDAAYLAAWADGEGLVIAVGGASPLANQRLAVADNGALAGWLVLDAPGAVDDLVGVGPGNQAGGVRPSVTILYDPVFAPGTRSLFDVIPTAAKWAGWQFLVAFALFALWRARRFGRPVTEPQPVELPGSLLVRASGELHRRSRGYQRAGQAIRDNLVGRLRSRFRIPADVPVTSLLELSGARADGDGAAVQREVEQVLDGPGPATADDLTALVGAVDRIESTLLGEESDSAPVDTEASQTVGDTT